MERPYSERSNRLKGVALIVAGVSLFAGLDAALAITLLYHLACRTGDLLARK